MHVLERVRIGSFALCAAILWVACGDSDSDGEQGGSAEGGARSASGRGGGGGSGRGATSSGGGTGGSMQGMDWSMQGVGGNFPQPFPGCFPDPPDPRVPDAGADGCLRCLAEQCCDELVGCGLVDQLELPDAGLLPGQRYHCYDIFFDCTRDCFDRELAAGSMTDSDELLVQCGKECSERPGATLDLFGYGYRNFLACTAGQPRPTLKPGTNMDEYIEGEADPDAGTAPNCIAQCLPSWR